MSDTNNSPIAQQVPPTVLRQSGPKAKTVVRVTHYQIVHSAVGVHRAGDIVPADALSDLQRLVDLGAIAATADPNGESE